MTRSPVLLRALALAALSLLAAGCQALLPADAELERRLAAFGGVAAPLGAPVDGAVAALRAGMERGARPARGDALVRGPGDR